MKIKTNKFNDLISSTINILLGILIIIFKGEVIRWGALVLGIIILCVGIVQLIFELKNNNSEQIFINIVFIIIGALIVVFAGAFATAIRIIVGILYIIYGALKLLRVFEMLPTFLRTIVFIEALLYVVVGILLFLDKSILYYIVGGLLIFNALIDVISILKFSNEPKTVNEHKDAIDVEVKEK